MTDSIPDKTTVPCRQSDENSAANDTNLLNDVKPTVSRHRRLVKKPITWRSIAWKYFFQTKQQDHEPLSAYVVMRSMLRSDPMQVSMLRGGLDRLSQREYHLFGIDFRNRRSLSMPQITIESPPLEIEQLQARPNGFPPQGIIKIISRTHAPCKKAN
ncbi:hypothetical protein TNCV_1169711 [Trichonephila clavipes]|uniref:Uncharacterized protein n=1 Tax=Trichonephila clavipes TaxID=2585209 RepID=A0A8X6SXA4_TRICX|nr:hypothetical protein TNCV_1169711 [Trichonephila clavipes]